MTPDELIARFGEQQMVGFALVLARIAPLFVLAPLFSSKTLPPRARTFVALALALGIAPIATQAPGDGAIPVDALGLAGLMVKEVLVGTAFSFGLAALFAALSAAGSVLDTLVGFSFGGLVDPVTGTQSSILSQLYSMVGVLVFIAIGGDAWVIQGLARTYEAVPLLEAPHVGSMVEGAQVAFSGLFAAAIQVSAPVLLALVITDAALGVVSRVVPQLNVFAVGFPAKVAVAVLIVGASLPFAAGWLSDELQRSVSTALQTLRVS
ncbi:MAG TPA: flagellar biosynthetic protein FliR [Solirubrobacteraceae bacterium]|nr:flagellar biosynthetic protein FliR [Solirubrobacteraceae bacterium]